MGGRDTTLYGWRARVGGGCKSRFLSRRTAPRFDTNSSRLPRSSPHQPLPCSKPLLMTPAVPLEGLRCAGVRVKSARLPRKDWPRHAALSGPDAAVPLPIRRHLRHLGNCAYSRAHDTELCMDIVDYGHPVEASPGLMFLLQPFYSARIAGSDFHSEEAQGPDRAQLLLSVS